MKIPAVQHIMYRQYNQGGRGLQGRKELQCKNLELDNRFYYPVNITFGLENAAPLKKLFKYGLPCMYTGVEMIAPQTVTRIVNMKLKQMTAKEICNEIDKIAHNLQDREKAVYLEIREKANLEPEKTLKEIMQQLKIEYEHDLIKKQIPIFKTLEAYSYSLPIDLQAQLAQLLIATYDKINHRPIISRFSVSEFKYKLEKIKDDIGKLHDKKALGIIKHFIKMSEEFAPKTNEKNIYSQRKIVSNMETILKRSALRENESLLNLFEETNAKLNEEAILIPFSRKSFIYDLSQIIRKSENPETREAFMKIAEKLPTSTDSTSAYIMKAANKPADKIVYNLLWPTMATIEHIEARFRGGKNVLSNYGGATAAVNSKLQHDEFLKKVERYPDTPKNSQKYLNRLIKYARSGIFEKENIDIKMIEDFKRTIATLSEGTIILDTSKLYKGGRFSKPEPALEFLNLNQ